MKKAIFALMALFLVFGGCVRSSALKRALEETDAARLQAVTAEKANKDHLEEIASIKKDNEELRTRNEALVEGNMKKSEEISSLVAVVKGKTSENAELRKKLDAYSSKKTDDKKVKDIYPTGGGEYRELLTAMKEDIDMGLLSILRGKETLSVLISEKALFGSDSTGLLPEGKALLQRISSARESLNSRGKHVQIRPIFSAIKGEKNKAAEEGLAVKRGAVIRNFLNERADEKEAAQGGLPYEETAGTTLTGFVVEIIFPYMR